MSHPRPSLVTLVAGIAYVGGAGYAVWLALDPTTYFFHASAQRAAWQVPWLVVALVCLLMLVEVLVVVWALARRPGRPVWPRAGLAAVTLAMWAIPSTLFGYLHAPMFLTWHAVWVWALLVVLLASTIGSLAVAGARLVTHGGGAPTQGPRPAA